MANEIYEIPVNRIDGTQTTLAEYKDKVLMVVNVASKCGLTPQYEGLEKLYENYRDQGFEVLGFPANNFMGQEPGTEEEIQEFCQVTYDVQFPLFQKISVKGEQQHPLYHFLTEAKPKTDISNGSEFADKLAGYGQTQEKDNDILWNFEKFLIGKSGEVVTRIAPDVTVDNADVVKAVEAEIGR